MNNRVYVSIIHRGVYMNPYIAPWEFELKMRKDGLRAFEGLFQRMNQLEGSNMWRAQLPYVPYHLDEENDQSDICLMKLYALIHEYGDESTKRFVEQLPYFNVRV